MVFRFAPHSGGSVIVGTEIANNLAKKGHKVTVITPDLELGEISYKKLRVLAEYPVISG